MAGSVVVTGGSKGIGKAIVEKFAKAGFQLITCARNQDDLERLKHGLQDIASKVETMAVDLSLERDTHKFADFVLSFGTPEVLINNAGIFIPGSIHEENEGVLSKMIGTNLYSAYHLTRKLLPSMIQQKRGHIFNICSTASIIPYVNGGSYCISKFALYGFSKVLREEMKAYNIRVTSVLPGATLTSSWEGVDLPDERFMKPEDVASGIFSAYRLSDNTVVEELMLRPVLGDI